MPLFTVNTESRQVQAGLTWWYGLHKPDAEWPSAWGREAPFARRLQAVEARGRLADNSTDAFLFDLDLTKLAAEAETPEELDLVLACIARAPMDLPTTRCLRAVFRAIPQIERRICPPGAMARGRARYEWVDQALAQLEPRFDGLDSDEQAILIGCYLNGRKNHDPIKMVLAILACRIDPIWKRPGARKVLETAGLDNPNGPAVVEPPWGSAAEASALSGPFRLTDLPDELIQHVVDLCGPNLHRMDRRDLCMRDIRAVVRLSATSHGFHARAGQQLDLAVACALRLEPGKKGGMTVAWRLSRLGESGTLVRRLSSPPASLSSAECMLWLIQCAIALPAPDEVQLALDLVKAGVTGTGMPLATAQGASAGPSFSVLLAHTIRQTVMAEQRALPRPWQFANALALLRQVAGMPPAEAVSVLIDLAVFLKRHDPVDRGELDMRIDGKWVSLCWTDLLGALKAVLPDADESLIRVAPLFRLEDQFRSQFQSTVKPTDIDEALDHLLKHPLPFTGATATALSIIEQYALSPGQAEKFAVCLANADARGRWRLFT